MPRKTLSKSLAFSKLTAFMSLKIGNPDPKHGSVKVDLRRFQIKTVKAQARE